MRSPLEQTDWALFSAFLLAAALGIWTSCLLVNDGAVYLAAAWLGNAWDLFFDQNKGRVVSTAIIFGPAWALRASSGISPEAFMVAAHVLYFAGPLVLWLLLRAVEPQRLFSRLYLAVVLAMVYFPTEQISGIGIWMVWLALVTDPRRTTRQAAIATVLLGIVLAFTHPSIALMSMLYLAVGSALAAFGRPVPRRSLVAAAVMSLILIVAYFATSRWLPATNPTVFAAQAANRYDAINPLWMLATMTRFPMLATFWLLLLAPGATTAALRWRLAPLAVMIVAAIGLWFAANGTGLLTYVYSRHTAAPVLTVAVALALAASATAWLTEARRPLMLYAAIASVAALSYSYDLLLYGRSVDRSLRPGIVDIDGPQRESWPTWQRQSSNARIYFKWAAEPDYVHDVVVPDYGRYRLSLAFYSFFRSDRHSVLFHRLPETEWIPFECRPVDRALMDARDDLDRRFLAFLREHYCVR